MRRRLAVLDQSRAADPLEHEAAVRGARRCRHIIQAVLREEEWGDADREFYLVIREELERLRELRGAGSNERQTHP